MLPSPLMLSYDPLSASITGYPPVKRMLSSLSGCFADQTAYQACLSLGDPFVYHVSSVETTRGEGQLHYGLGLLMPGRVGSEYYLTRGHVHAWLPAAEVYICLSGRGMMLLEDIRSGECSAVELSPTQVAYVPGYTAHRTVNTGFEPLVYWGIYSCDAGHDYAYVKDHNFSRVVVEVDGMPAVIDRESYLKTLSHTSSKRNA